MKLVEFDPRSPEWLEWGIKKFRASKAPDQMGHGYDSRSKYLREFGNPSPPPNSFLQKKFDEGNAAEAAARPLAELIVEAALEEKCAETDEHDMARSNATQEQIETLTPLLSASFDGITPAGDWIWEHKLWSAKLAASVSEGVVPLQHRIQMEQQFLISGASRGLFMISDPEQTQSDHLIIYPDMALRRQILEGWMLFHADLQNKLDLSEDAAWLEAEIALANSRAALHRAKLNAEQAEQALKDMAAGRNVAGSQFDVSQIKSPGRVSYASAIKDLTPKLEAAGIEFDTEQYRSKPSAYIQIKERKANERS